MAVKIRLDRKGRKKVPYYWIVVINSRKARSSGCIEQIGTYDPLLDGDLSEKVKINDERYKHWISQGAQPTETVAKLYGKIGSFIATQANS